MMRSTDIFRIPGQTFLIVTAVLFFSSSCIKSKTRQQQEVVLNEKTTAPMTMMEVAGHDKGKVTKTKKSKKSARENYGKNAMATSKGRRPISLEAQKKCLALYKRIVIPYQSLHTKLDKATYVSSNSLLDQMVELTPAVCDQTESFNTAAAIMNNATSEHSGQIGIILPLTGKNNQLTTFIVKGMRAAFTERQLNFETKTVLKDSTVRTAETLLAELVFRDKVAAVIGGFETRDAQELAKWSKLLMLPVVITNPDRDVGNLSRYAYMLYPDEMRLAYTLAAEADSRGIKRIAILKPTSHKSDSLVEYFKKAVTARGGQITFDLLYTPGNFDSMQAVSRTIFKVDGAERADEFRTAFRRAKRRAQEQNAPFDPRMVVLKPIINFDAVFLPDDFRTARHFAKLFRFHQVAKMTMIGNHEWRSPALIEPFDEFLEGSFFADFIGSYAKLPQAISAPTAGSPYFVQPQSVLAVDFQLIGYRAGRVGSIISEFKTTNRRQLPAKIDAIASNNSAFFGNGLVFEKDHQSNWPTYVFGIAAGSIQLEKEQTQLNLPSAPQKSSQTMRSENLSSAKSG